MLDGENESLGGSGMSIWVGIADLFAGLLLVVLVGLIVTTGRYNQLLTERDQLVEKLTFSEELRRAVNEAVKVNALIKEHLETALPPGGQRPTYSEMEISIPSVVLFNSFSYDDFLHDPDRQYFLSLIRRAIAESMDNLNVQARYLRIVIEGHTDSDPIIERAATKAIPTNWELSSRRATGVLRFFEAEGLGSEEFEIVALGRADTMPIADNRTDQGKEQNRRIVIRIEPNLDRIRRDLARQKLPEFGHDGPDATGRPNDPE